MTGLERMITKCVNAVTANAARQAERVPTLGEVEAESLYLSRWEAIEAEEKHLRLMIERPIKAIHYGCE